MDKFSTAAATIFSRAHTAVSQAFVFPTRYHALGGGTAAESPADRDRHVRTGAIVGAKPRRMLAFVGALLVLTLVGSAVHRPGIWGQGGGVVAVVAVNDKPPQHFVDAVLADPVEGVLDPEPILQKCRETEIHPGMVWQCPPLTGGIGNAGNEFLNCVRYALEAGAETLILPRMFVRNPKDLFDLGSGKNTADLSIMFDTDHFLGMWQKSCPQIRAVLSAASVPHLSHDNGSPEITPSKVKEFPMQKYTILDPTGWREAFDEWMVHEPGFKNMSAAHPVLVRQSSIMFEWTHTYDAPEFVRSFSRLFRFPLATRRLAATALWNMQKKVGRSLVGDGMMSLDSDDNDNNNNNNNNAPPPSPSLPVARTSRLGPHRLAADGFLGAHLRVAKDAVKAGWPGYEAQAPHYIAEARKRHISTIYLATGSPEHRGMFCAAAASEGLEVLTKEDVLDTASLQELRSLTWDQQALVDFDVLMRSSFFYGFVYSSYSWLLAYRRGTLPEAGRPWPDHALVQDEYRDKISAIAGHHGIAQEGIWP